MPQRRQFSQEISGNTPQGPNLTPEESGRSIRKYEAGYSAQELAAEFGRTDSGIRKIIQKWTTRHTTKDLP